MCRFLAYTGAPLLLTDLLYRPANSLVSQSHRAREMGEETLNGDGFGIGWYAPDVDPTPCVQRSILPAWSSYNLQNLAAKIRSSFVFAHVRAASPGMLVTETNVHPFSYDRFMWMHNGGVSNFHHIKRRLRESLKDEFYEMIQGTTDSEHCFAFFLNCLNGPFSQLSHVELRHALVATIAQLHDWAREDEIAESSFYNFAVTDGKSIVVSRCSQSSDVKGRSLYYARNSSFAELPPDMNDASATLRADAPPSVIVSSERLTDETDVWMEVPDNHTITVTAEMRVEVEPIGL